MKREDDEFDCVEARGEKQYYVLVIYDIVENKRRTKFAKFLQGYGKRVQKSAFEAFLSGKKYDKLINKVPPFCIEEDSIRVYRISGTGQVSAWGKAAPGEEEKVIVV